MPRQVVHTDLHVTGGISADGSNTPSAGSVTNSHVASTANISRTKLEQTTLAKQSIQLTAMRVWDALHTLLPAAGAADDLGLVGGTFGTNTPMLKTSDSKATSVTQRCRFTFTLPPSYDDAETVQIRAHAGMETTISDSTATIDFEVYESDREGGLGSDLCSTAATTINSLTAADVDFTIDASGLVAGDELDVRVSVAITDGATGTAVTGVVGSIAVLADIRG